MHTQPPYSPGGTLSTGHYEFTDEENQKIALTGQRAKLWGYISITTGVLALVGLVVSLIFKDELVSHGLEANYVTVFVVALVPIVLTHLVISMLYMGAGKSLQAIVHTQGNDVEHLMQSLDKLGTAFLVEFAIGMLAVVVSTGVGIQMAIDNVAAEKAAELARAEAESAQIAAAAEEEGEGEGEEDGDTDAEPEGEGQVEGEEAEGDTDGAAAADEAAAAEGGTGQAADEEAAAGTEGEAEEAAEGDVEVVEDGADEAEPAAEDEAAPAEETAAG